MNPKETPKDFGRDKSDFLHETLDSLERMRKVRERNAELLQRLQIPGQKHGAEDRKQP